MAESRYTPNDLFRQARVRMYGTREALAEAVNAHLAPGFLVTANDIGKIERGVVTFPRKLRRAAYRIALQAASDVEIGLRDSRSASLPSQGEDEPQDHIADCQCEPERKIAPSLLVHGADEPEDTDGLSGTATAWRGQSTSVLTQLEQEVAETPEPGIGMTRRQVVAGIASPIVNALVRAVIGSFNNDEPFLPKHALTHEELSGALSNVRRAYQHSQYAAATAALPGVLASIRVARGDLDVRSFAALESEAYQVASGLLLKSSEPVLAAIAAERCTAAAERTEEELVIAGSARAMAHCLIAVGHAQEGVRLAISGADRLSARVNMKNPAALSVYGALLLRGAIAAAREEEREQAHELLEAASRAAAHLGQDRNLLWTAFGPANVAAHRVAVSVELGDAGAAVAYANKTNMDALELPERKAMVLLDTARAFTQWGKWERAFGAIRQAEQFAPEEIRQRPAIQQLIRKLAQRSPGSLRAHIESYAAQVRPGA